MQYTVKSKKSLNNLKGILDGEGLSVDLINELELLIKPKDEAQKEALINSLSFYIACNTFEYSLFKNYLKHGISEEVIKQYIDVDFTDFPTVNYLYTLTRILVKEYLKKIDVIHIESFGLFNMKGFKKEIKEYADENIQNEKEIEQFNPLSEPNVVGMEDFFEMIRVTGLSAGLNLEEFKEIHIEKREEKFVLLNSTGIEINNKFFLKNFGIFLEIKMSDDLYPDIREIIESIFTLINVFDSNKVIVHQSLDKEEMDNILASLTELKQTIGKAFKIVICNGCLRCY